MKISLGQTVVTIGVSGLIESQKIHHSQILEILSKQENCDWGTSSDKALNDAAARHGNDRCMGVHTVNGIKLWVITEADRSSTTILLPSEY